ncbi:MAG: carbohydrate kinase family protein [bacterium]|nr:carbohydrate kinase family protein [bacterium]
MGNYDFIGIGDIVTDAFIKLKEATIENSPNGGTGDGFKKLCMRFGDKIPYEEVIVVPAVGNSVNATVAASRLGLKSAIITNIGDDYYGQECLDVLRQEKIGAEFVKINKEKKTNYHYVLTFNAERTILIKHEEYDYSLPASLVDLPAIQEGEPKCVYLSSLGENSLPFHLEIEKYLNEHPHIKVAFQPGTFQMKFGKEKLAGIYKRADLFFCNKEEAQRILETKEEDIKNLIAGIHALGSKIVSITNGPNGAYASDAKNIWFLPIYPDPKPPINRTGAGDAYSSTFTSAIIMGKSIEEAMMWGPINSMSVVQQTGARAGLLTKEKLEEYLKQAPMDYKPEKI